MYRETHLEKRLEVKNVASLPCRIQLLTKRPFYVKLLDDADNTIPFDLDAEPQASATDPVKT